MKTESILSVKNGEYFFMPKRISFILASLICLFSVWWINTPPLFKGYANTFEIYLLSASSTSEIKQVNAIQYRFSGRIFGESCILTENQTEQFDVMEFLSKFSAKVVEVEEIGGCISYYAYSNKIDRAQNFNGQAVNLHVAVRDGMIKIGSPIIFGSF